MIFADMGNPLALGTVPGDPGSGFAPVAIVRESDPIARYSAAKPAVPSPAPIPIPNGGPGGFPSAPAPVPNGQPAAIWPLPSGETVKDLKWIVIGGVAFLGILGLILVLK